MARRTRAERRHNTERKKARWKRTLRGPLSFPDLANNPRGSSQRRKAFPHPPCWCWFCSRHARPQFDDTSEQLSDL